MNIKHILAGIFIVAVIAAALAVGLGFARVQADPAIQVTAQPTTTVQQANEVPQSELRYVGD